MTLEAFNQSEALTKARMDIAVHEAQIAALHSDINELKTAFNTQAQLLQQVLTTLSEARGGWRTLMLVGGMSTTVGAVLMWVAENVFGRHP